MANTLDNIMPKILARGLLALRQQCWMPQLVNGSYSEEAAEKGTVVEVPIAASATATAVVPGPTPPTPASKAPTKVLIPLDQWYHSDFHLNDKELVEIDRSRHFIPLQASEAIKAIANNINEYLWQLYKGVYGFHGTPGTTPFASSHYDAVAVRQILNDQLCPRDMRRMVIDSVAETNALMLGAFVDMSKSGDNNPIQKGAIGEKLGMGWYSDDHVPTHTAGTITTGLIAKAATVQAVGDTSIVCTTAASTGACALKEGDIITFASHAQTYVVTEDATQASAASDVTVNISPGLTVALAGSEAVSVKSSHTVNMAFHRDAFAFAMRPLVQDTISLEMGNRVMAMRDEVTGLVLRLEVMRQYKQIAWDFDVLYGGALVRPEFASRLAG